MRLTRWTSLCWLVALTTASYAASASAALVTLDNFNVNEGRFGLAPGFSGSNANIDGTAPPPVSTADRITTGSYEGAGNQQLVLNATTAGATQRLRFLSGGGAAAGGSGQPANTVITTGAGVDGWIGMALKTTSPGYTVQMWLEGVENNGSVPKNVIADGLWHIYEWNLDDQTGGPDGWGAVAGIVAGDADFENGNYTIDSILFRNTAAPAEATIFMDFVARNPDGRIPEPATLVMAGLGLLGCLAIRRKVA